MNFRHMAAKVFASLEHKPAIFTDNLTIEFQFLQLHLLLNVFLHTLFNFLHFDVEQGHNFVLVKTSFAEVERWVLN